MKLVKSLLLGTAAGLAAVAGAQAADLPARKAAPVEYVRVCSTYGAGFFYVPGTEGCLRVGGQVRADYQWTERFTRGDDAVGFYARGRVQLDHRQATAYGLLRTFVRMEIARGSGSRLGGDLLVGGAGDLRIGPNPSQAFIQFGGLTAGRVTSFFDNPDLPTFHMIGLRFSDNPDTQLIAYTATFGGGFSATISLEDPEERQSTFVAGGTAFPVIEGGSRIPDVVANVRYAGTWGNIQLSGALTQTRDAGVVGGRIIGPGIVANQAFADSELGFAVMLNGGINLDAIGAGDKLWFAASYADGALGYLGAANGFGAAGIVGLTSTSAIVNPFNGDIDTVKGWSIAGGFQHNWSPMFRSGIFASYARIDAPGYASTFVTTGPFAGTVTGLNDGSELRVGANTFWTPVSGLDLGLEVMYTKVDPRGRVQVNQVGPAATVVTTRGSDDFWQGRVRVQRTF